MHESNVAASRVKATQELHFLPLNLAEFTGNPSPEDIIKTFIGRQVLPARQSSLYRQGPASKGVGRFQWRYRGFDGE